MSENTSPFLSNGLAIVLETCNVRSVIDAAALLDEAGGGRWSFYLTDHSAPVLTPGTASWTPETWPVLCAVAAQTSGCQLGSMVSPLLLYDRARLADMIATCDSLAPGRLVVGLGAGWHEGDFRAYGVSFPQPADRMRMLVEQVTDLRAKLDERGVSTDRVPLVVGGFGHRLLTATRDLVSGFCSFGPPEDWLRRRSLVPGAADKQHIMLLSNVIECGAARFEDVAREATILLMCESTDKPEISAKVAALERIEVFARRSR